MDINQIMLLAIVVLIGIIIILGLYFLVTYLLSHKQEKHSADIFNPENLVEEESLMNVMDEKRTVEFVKKANEEKFIGDNSQVEIVKTDTLKKEEKINPFGVDMSKKTRTQDENSAIGDIPNNDNKFIK